MINILQVYFLKHMEIKDIISKNDELQDLYFDEDGTNKLQKHFNFFNLKRILTIHSLGSLIWGVIGLIFAINDFLVIQNQSWKIRSSELPNFEILNICLFILSISLIIAGISFLKWTNAIGIMIHSLILCVLGSYNIIASIYYQQLSYGNGYYNIFIYIGSIQILLSIISMCFEYPKHGDRPISKTSKKMLARCKIIKRSIIDGHDNGPIAASKNFLSITIEKKEWVCKLNNNHVIFVKRNSNDMFISLKSKILIKEIASNILTSDLLSSTKDYSDYRIFPGNKNFYDSVSAQISQYQHEIICDWKSLIKKSN